ncbi:M1 family metallopeptidase [Algoriphagus machipongonensis]|uniref:Aminopeptidase N n=1 Tax=Algoriphagus machipongonensis TaxID=388413 RepID=A3HX29_9BACT|nr:M1 family aminopeptidase [Algoriphagus machipongonensis]EAZ81152.2 putative aminopeptidase [Algoriphagus machipongonensis]
MKNLFLLFCTWLLISSCENPVSDQHFYDEGISAELAKFRKQQVSEIHYQLQFDIPEKKTDPIPAKLILETSISDLSHPLILDFHEEASHLISLKVNGNETEINHRNQHLIIAEDRLEKGSNSIEINFLAGELSLNRNDDFLYTLLVPDRASTLFPCFDQPNLKANYSLTISAPNEWKVLAGAPEIASEESDGSTIHRFAKSDLMSTYLFSFVAGNFEEAKAEGDFPQRMLYRETNSEKIAASIPEVFSLHEKAKDFLEAYTDYPFPFQKLDFTTIPIFQYGGMEHVGAIQYRESSLFLDENATNSQLLSRAKLIGHETAHMWFGDLVTMDWFEDVWMKEVFANFMAGKLVNPAYPDINHELSFLTNHYPSAYGEDRTKGTNPIRQDLANLKDAGSLYGSIIYNKAPIMMRQLETVMGEDAFQKGIQTYIKTFANSNARWSDLVEILNRETALDLKEWSEVWVNQSGRPIISDEIEFSENGNITSFKIHQKAEDGSEKVWPQLFNLTFFYPQESKTIEISLNDKTINLEEAIGLEKPTAILYNSNGLGYGVFPLDINSLEKITDLQDEVMRGQSYINLYENTLAGNISPKQTFEVLHKGILEEKNEILASLISSEMNSLFWTFLTKDQRESKISKLEEDLWTLLQQDISTNLKKTLFSLYSGLAYSESGQNRLYQVWDKSIEIENLKLNPDDFTSLAMKLALYGHPKSEEILVEERSRISNPDKLARFDFLQPALSQNESERDALFESFRNMDNREKESWVLAACGYIHHPLHQATSVKHVPLALELLDEIQKTGDIFFPKRWVSATVGQYSSQKAANDVNVFLEANPDYNPILKNKILQATDDLMRVQKIKGQE